MTAQLRPVKLWTWTPQAPKLEHPNKLALGCCLFPAEGYELEGVWMVEALHAA